MNCAKSHRLFSSYLDGELSLEEQEALAGHLQSCRSCRAAEAEMRVQRQLFAGLPRLAAPLGFSARVMGNLDQASVGCFTWHHVFVGFAEVAVLGVIILTGIVSGGFLVDRLNPAKMVTASLGLDLFEPAPPDSLGGVYLALTEVANER